MQTSKNIITAFATLIMLTTCQGIMAATPSDTIVSPAQSPAPLVNLHPLTLAGGVIAPMIIYDALHYHQDASIRRMRFHYASGNKAGWDDFTQFAPLATAWGMRIAGVKGRSDNYWETASAHALSYGIGMGMTYAVKFTVKRERPDGSDRRSFPSGHTMAAFAGATILDAEYGGDYPWLSALGYGVAIATGVGRIYNNKHYATDVIAGAGMGIVGTYLGYLINDLIWGRGIDRLSPEYTRENYESPVFIKMSKGRQSLLDNIGEYSADKSGNLVGIEGRYPIYKQVGIRLGAQMWESYSTTTELGANTYALLLGADFMQGLWRGRLWVDGGITTGYHSGIRLAKGSLSQPRSETGEILKGGIPVMLNAGVSFITTDRLAINLNAEYAFLPSVKLHGYGISMGLAYLLNF